MTTPALVRSGDLKRMELEHSRGKSGWIYFVTNAEAETVKIGFSVDLGRRMEVLQTGNHVRLMEYAGFRSAPYAERVIQRIFRDQRLHGEWFKHTDELDDMIQCFEDKADERDGGLLTPADVVDAIDDWANSYGRGRSSVTCGQTVDNP